MPAIHNKKLGFNYEIVEKFTAGIELLGTEVKSVKLGRGILDNGFVIIRGGEVFLVNANIPAYQPKNAPRGYDPERPRKLLLTKKEIRKLGVTTNQKGLTIVPVSMYSSGRKVKIDIAVARGKKKYDKREDIKKREAQKDIEREIKNRNTF